LPVGGNKAKSLLAVDGVSAILAKGHDEMRSGWDREEGGEEAGKEGGARVRKREVNLERTDRI